jgi:hypothetical protein
MFHFQRRTLWIIIYVTIPLIIILNNLGGEDVPPPAVVSQNPVGLWSLDQVKVNQRDNLSWLVLPGASTLELTVVLDEIPSSQISVQNPEAFNRYFQGGKFVVTVSNPVNEAALTESLRFLMQWLPPNISAIVMSGPYRPEWAELVGERLSMTSGQGVDISFAAIKGLAKLESPAMSSPDQLAFLITVSILKQRMAGYDIQMTWDHRRSSSFVTFNSTLAEDIFYPVSEDEFEPVHQAFVQSASVRERSQSQLHRYALTAVVYGLPFSFFVEQPERIAAVKIEDVNKMMEFALEQIKTR